MRTIFGHQYVVILIFKINCRFTSHCGSVSSTFVCIRLLGFYISQMTWFCSILQEGFELPSRLSVCAADCVVSLTSALTTKAEVQTRQKRLNVSSSYQQVTFFSNAVDDQREKPISSSSKDSDSDMEYLLWHQLKDLVILVQRLLAVCFCLHVILFFCFAWYSFNLLNVTWNLRWHAVLSRLVIALMQQKTKHLGNDVLFPNCRSLLLKQIPIYKTTLIAFIKVLVLWLILF